MKERLDPYRGEVKVQPHEMRGSFEECRFQARIMDRQQIDNDQDRSTGMVTFDLHNTGITFQPVSISPYAILWIHWMTVLMSTQGDRLAVMPANPSYETAKVAAALGLDDLMDSVVPVEQGSEWARFSKHLEIVSKAPSGGLTVKEVLRRGHLAPLTKDLVLSVGNVHTGVRFPLSWHRFISSFAPLPNPLYRYLRQTNGRSRVA